MESRARADIYINLPALRKLDSMLMVVTSYLLLKKTWRYKNKMSHCFFNLFYCRRHWIVFRRQSFGMQKKEACQWSRRVLQRDPSGKWLFRGKKRNGGYQFLWFRHKVYQRGQGNSLRARERALIKSTKLLWQSIAASLLKWIFQIPTWQLFQRYSSFGLVYMSCLKL